MLKGLTLTELAGKIEAQSTMKRDFIADTSKLTMQVAHRDPKLILPSDAPRPVLELPDGHGTFPILSLAHDQIGSHTKIPAQYYDRMLAEAPDLLATNVNAWFRINGVEKSQPVKRMIRTLGGDARAFLSNRYQRIENEEIAEVALPILMDLPQVKIVSCEVTERRLYIHFVVPGVQGEVKVGDVVQAGGILSNSEVGCGSVSVTGMAWRLICLNGMKTTDTFRRNHVGRRVDDNEALWADDTRKADDKAILLKVRDMVRGVVDETRFRAQLQKWQGLLDGEIKGDPAAAVEVLSRKVGANEAEKGGILRALIKGGDLSRWGIVNAITAQAHEAKSYDRAVEFEGMGGALVDLPRNEWKEILEAV